MTISMVIAFLATAPPALPVFLDGFDRLTIALDPPMAAAEIGQRFRFRINGEGIPIRSIRLKGDPIRPRSLPRSLGRVVLPGTFQSALGGTDWDPDGEFTQMTETSQGVFEWVGRLPEGRYEYKIARNGGWGENWGQNFEAGGQNLVLDVPSDRVVRIRVDFNRKTVETSLEHDLPAPTQAPPRPRPTGPDVYAAVEVELMLPLNPEDLDEDLRLLEGDQERRVYPRGVLDDRSLYYEGSDLGARWTADATTFKVWSPVSKQAELLLFNQADGGAPRVLPMAKGRAGVWFVRVPGNLHGHFYQYRFHRRGEVFTATDLYSFAANRRSTRSMVIDLNQTDPPSWPSQTRVRHRQQTDAVLYEIHVRDFTVHPSSGVRPEYRGKYLGLAQIGTRVPGSSKRAGLDYLADLGVTDIHLLPLHNILSGDTDEYNWGYITNLFNVPEESYSTTPNDPVNVIREFKTMVSAMHRAGLRVVMDVVYNHTWPPQGPESNFWATVPYYYFRTNDRGDVLNESGVGNALHDERPMARKFVRESLLFWMDEYRIDGYRFDLLGMHHPDSVRNWTRAMRAKRPDAVLYGEPWTGGGPNRFGKGAQRGTTMAVFNDRFRNAFRGELDGPGAGFAMGGGVDPAALKRSLAGSIDGVDGEGFTDTPIETINYVSAHDNLTLLDKIALSMPNDNLATHRRSVRLVGAGVLLAQGVPFLEGGAQIGRTKGGNRNSYNAGDAANQYDWARSLQFQADHAYYRGLIQLRRSEPVLRLASADEVRRRIRFRRSEPRLMVWELASEGLGSQHRELLLVLNGDRTSARVTLPEGSWKKLVHGDQAGIASLGSVQGTVEVEPLSASVLAR